MTLNWDRIPGVVAKHAVPYVTLTLLYAFVAGAIVSAVLFGSRPLLLRNHVARPGWRCLALSFVHFSSAMS
jgi:hypothetical protein